MQNQSTLSLKELALALLVGATLSIAWDMNVMKTHYEEMTAAIQADAHQQELIRTQRDEEFDKHFFDGEKR